MFCPIFLGSMKINLVFIWDENPQKYTTLFQPDSSHSHSQIKATRDPSLIISTTTKKRLRSAFPRLCQKRCLWIFVEMWKIRHTVPLSLKSASDLIVEIIAAAVRREESSSDGRCLSQTEIKMQNNPLHFCPDSIILKPLYSSRHDEDGDN